MDALGYRPAGGQLDRQEIRAVVPKLLVRSKSEPRRKASATRFTRADRLDRFPTTRRDTLD
jgi:hypothetical protein